MWTVDFSMPAFIINISQRIQSTYSSITPIDNHSSNASIFRFKLGYLDNQNKRNKNVLSKDNDNISY